MSKNHHERSGWTVPIAHLGQGICLTLRQLKGRNVTRIDLGFLDANSCCFRGNAKPLRTKSWIILNHVEQSKQGIDVFNACSKRLSILKSKLVVYSTTTQAPLSVSSNIAHLLSSGSEGANYPHSLYIPYEMGSRLELLRVSQPSKHWPQGPRVWKTPGNNQLGDNAAAAIASLIHALPKLKSLLLAGNILGSLGSGGCGSLWINGVWTWFSEQELANWRDNPPM